MTHLAGRVRRPQRLILHLHVDTSIRSHICCLSPRSNLHNLLNTAPSPLGHSTLRRHNHIISGLLLRPVRPVIHPSPYSPHCYYLQIKKQPLHRNTASLPSSSSSPCPPLPPPAQGLCGEAHSRASNEASNKASKAGSEAKTECE